jgi:hypothetical protein
MIGSLFSQLLCVSLLLGIIGAYDCPLEECDACLRAEIREAPGVGFELTPSYGSVLDSFYVPTTLTLEKDVLRKLLQRCSIGRSVHRRLPFLLGSSPPPFPLV